jgi:hypothetical protein
MLSHVENVGLGNNRRRRAAKACISKGKTVYFMILALIIVSSILASQNASAIDLNIEDFQWKKRLLLIFSPNRADPLFNSLANEISSRREDVEDRDLVIFEILESGASKMNSSELEPQKAASFQKQFEIPENTFTVILLGKDGGIKLKRSDHVRLEEIFRLIDSMPMRQDEMRQKRL